MPAWPAAAATAADLAAKKADEAKLAEEAEEAKLALAEPIPEGCPKSAPVTWSNSDVLRWLISIDATGFLELFVELSVTGRTLLLLHLDDRWYLGKDQQYHLKTFVKKYLPDDEHVNDPLRQHSLAENIKALISQVPKLELMKQTGQGDDTLKNDKLIMESHNGWTTEVEFRVWREYFMLGLDRSLALAHQAVWQRQMHRYNLFTTLLSGFAALIGTLGLALFQEQQGDPLTVQDNDTYYTNGTLLQEGELFFTTGDYSALLSKTHVGSFRWCWSLLVTLISLLVTLVSAQAAKHAPKAEAAIKMVDRYTIWVRRCRYSRATPPLPRNAPPPHCDMPDACGWLLPLRRLTIC